MDEVKLVHQDGIRSMSAEEFEQEYERLKSTQIFMDDTKGCVFLNGVLEPRLSRLPYEVLHMILRHRRAAHREQIIDVAWEDKGGASDDAFDQVLKRIRKILREHFPTVQLGCRDKLVILMEPKDFCVAMKTNGQYQ